MVKRPNIQNKKKRDQIHCSPTECNTKTKCGKTESRKEFTKAPPPSQKRVIELPLVRAELHESDMCVYACMRDVEAVEVNICVPKIRSKRIERDKINEHQNTDANVKREKTVICHKEKRVKRHAPPQRPPTSPPLVPAPPPTSAPRTPCAPRITLCEIPV